MMMLSSPSEISTGRTDSSAAKIESNLSTLNDPLQARAFAWAVFMPLEGNTFASGNEWTDNNTIDPENVSGQLLGGFHVVRNSWGLHFTWLIGTDNVDEDSLMPGVDPEGDFGTIMVEWRF